jgi:hypothetical protein
VSGFALALAVCGCGAGTWAGGRWLVAPGSGLAGPAIALGYGLLAATGTALIAVLLAARLPFGWLRIATATAVLVALYGLGSVAAVLMSGD